MIFNQHLELKDKHALLSPSNYHWLDYDDEKLVQVYFNMKQKEIGTRLHEYAQMAIENKRFQLEDGDSVNSFINDALRFEMSPEQPLYYSENCFGTADALSCDDGILRIHDLKTGKTPASMKQLLIYSALFCMEYHIRPTDIHTELRIYQNNEIIIYEPEPSEIRSIIRNITKKDKILNKVKKGARL